MPDVVTAIAAVVAVLVSVAALVVAVRSARSSDRSAAAAEDSAESARRSADAETDVARIERDRYHRENAPSLSITLIKSETSGAQLSVWLRGPRDYAEAYLEATEFSQHVGFIASGMILTRVRLGELKRGHTLYTPVQNGHQEAQNLGVRVVVSDGPDTWIVEGPTFSIPSGAGS